MRYRRGGVMNRSVLFVSSLLFSGFLISATGALPTLRATNVETVEQFFGTRNVKLVVSTIEHGLLMVDYSETVQGEPVVQILTGTHGAILPVISPDGKWVTYATGATEEYTDQRSTAWIRPLSASGTAIRVCVDSGYVPRFKQNATNPTIIFSTKSFGGGDKYTFQGEGQVLAREWLGGSQFVESVIWDKGSYLGGLSWDGRYLGHAEQNRYAFLLDLQGGDTLPEIVHCFERPIQVCNSSISSSRIFTGALMYFDFGALGTPMGSWGLHKRFFIGGRNGAVLRVYNVPAELQGAGISDAVWNHPEWSNHPYYAAASAEISRGRESKNEQIYGVNLKDSVYLKLVENTEINLNWPWIWVEVEQGFQEDPQWLSQPWYVSNYQCALKATEPPPPPPKTKCGTGVGLAFLPPVAFRLARRRKARI